MATKEMTQGKLTILKAVSNLMEDPSSKITISKIAKTVHVTDAAIYRHYKSKEEIFTALLSYMEDNLLEPLQDANTIKNKTIYKAEIIFLNYVDFFESHPGLTRMFLGHSSSEAAGMTERIQILHAKIRTNLAIIFKTAKEIGEISQTLEAEQITEIFYGLIIATAMAQSYNFPQIETSQRWNGFKKAIIG